MIIFLTIAITLTGLLHWFLYARLVHALDITSPAVLWLLRILTAFLAISYIIARSAERGAPEWIVQILHWISSVWIGLMWTLLWITAAVFVGKQVLVAVGFWSRFGVETVSAIGKYSVIGTAAIAVALCGYAAIKAYGPANIVNFRIPVRNMPDSLRNLRIAVASDFHAGVLIGKNDVARMADQIMSLKPDLILLPGDIIDRDSNDIGHISDSFRRLNAPLGVYGSTGNHEYYTGVKSAVEFCQKAGIRMLMNEWIEVTDGVVIAGIEDRTAAQMGFPRPKVAEFVGTIPKDKFTILLNHSPITAEAEAAGSAGADLMLSGHTHRGQLWPFSLLAAAAFKYFWGLYETSTGHIAVTSGIGSWGPPMRLGAPPEIGLVQFVIDSKSPNG